MYVDLEMLDTIEIETVIFENALFASTHFYSC